MKPHRPQVQVAPIHFEDFSGEQFERLAFALILRDARLKNVEWNGQSGGDGGKDIVAEDVDGNEYLFLCANYKGLTFQKVKSDIAKVAANPPNKLCFVAIVAGGKVTAKLRKKAKAEIRAKLQVRNSEVWSGSEFEERLRLRAPDLLKRFVQGETFPELPDELRAFAASAVEDAIQADAKRIASLDPRWDVKLDVVDFTKHYTLHAKENISAQLKVSGSNVAKLKEHFDFGTPVKLDGYAVSIEGLFEHLQKEMGQIQSIAVAPAKPKNVEFHFWTEGKDGFRFTIPGQITGGQLGVSFESKLNSGAPIRVGVKVLKPELKAQSGSGKLSLSFAFEEWENRPISTLPYFDKAQAFIGAIVDGHPIRHEMTIDGNRATGGTLGQPADVMPFAFAAAVVGTVARARYVADRLNTRAQFPRMDDLTPEAADAIDFAHALLSAGNTPLRGKGFSVGIRLFKTTRPPAEVLDELERRCAQGQLTFPQNTTVFGTPVSLGDVTYKSKQFRLVIEESERSAFLAGTAEGFEGKIEALPDADVTVAIENQSAGE